MSWKVPRQVVFRVLNAENYDILHFAGHGQINDKGQGEILLREFATGKTDAVSAMELGSLMHGSGIRLVFLSSCSTSAGDFGKEFAVLAKTLVEVGIPVVVAKVESPSPTVSLRCLPARFTSGSSKGAMPTGRPEKDASSWRSTRNPWEIPPDSKRVFPRCTGMSAGAGVGPMTISKYTLVHYSPEGRKLLGKKADAGRVGTKCSPKRPTAQKVLKGAKKAALRTSAP